MPPSSNQVEPSNPNRCPVDGCPKGRRSGQLMCKQHWYMVPVELRKRVWATAREMWESTEARADWEQAADIAVTAVEEKEAANA